MRIKAIITSLTFAIAAAALVGCAAAKVTKTTTTLDKDGKPVVVKDEVAVNSFLSSIKNGKYTSTNSDGTSQTLSTDDTSPDQQSIAVLAGGVVDLGKEALLLLKKQTNAPVLEDTNSAPSTRRH